MFENTSLTKGNTSSKMLQAVTLTAASIFGTQDLTAQERPAVDRPAATATDTAAERDLTTSAVRVELLEEIRTIAETISNSAEPEKRREVFVAIKPMVIEYSEALLKADDATYEELENAKNLNFSVINYTHRVGGLEHAEAVSYVVDMVLPFYEAQVPKLREFAENNPDKQGGVNSLLSSIRSDVKYCLGFNLPEGERAAANSTLKLFLNHEVIESLKDYQSSALDRDGNPVFTLILVEATRDLLTKVSKEAFDELTTADASEAKKIAGQVLAVHTKLHTVLKEGGADYYKEEQLAEAREWLQDTLARPIFDDMPAILAASMGNSSSFNAKPVRDNLLQVAESLGDTRVELGREYVENLKGFISEHETEERFRLEAYRLLAHFAPDPHTLQFAAEDLEEMFVNQRSPRVTPDRIVPALGAILFASARNEIEDEKSTFRGISATGQVSMLVSADLDPEKLHMTLPPAHILLAKILKTGLSDGLIAGFPELGSADYETKKDITDTCRASTLRILNDLAKSYPRDLHARNSHSFSFLTIPADWGGAGVSLRTPESETEATESDIERSRRNIAAGKGLYGLVDTIALRLVAVPEVTGQQELLEHMVRVIDLTEVLGHSGNPVTGSIENTMKRSFPYISTRSSGDGPFEHMYQKAQEMQYQRIYHKSAPEPSPSDEILARAQWRDKRIDSVSIDFANTAKERFKCDLALALLGTSQKTRPLEGHQILSDERMKKKLMIIMHRFGMFELIPGRKDFNPERPAASDFEVILEDAPGDQLRAALSARSASLKERQLELLKNIRGIEE